MQKASITTFDVEEYISHLEAHHITEKDMKTKSHRINAITPTKQQFYLSDVKELYQWLVIFNRHRDFRDFIVGEKNQKDFMGDHLFEYLKNLIYCRQFRLSESMQLCQAVMIESLNFFIRYFGEIDKYPDMINIPRMVLDLQRHFFRVNHEDSKFHCIPFLSQQQEETISQFTLNLKVGDKVDALKTEPISKRKIWSPAVISKIGSQSVLVIYEGERSPTQKAIFKCNYEIFPLQTFTKDKFQWRSKIKVGDYIDYEFQKHYWKKVKVLEVIEQDESSKYEKLLTLQQELIRYPPISPYSPLIQLPNTFSRQNINIDQQYMFKDRFDEQGVDDFNDILLERQQYIKAAVLRNQICSRFYIQLVNHFQQIKGFDLIYEKIKNPATHINISQSLLHFISFISIVFHRRFALEYLPKLCEAMTYNILHCSQSNIRVFTKDKFKNIMENIHTITKRYMVVRERKNKQVQIIMPVIKMFIDSEFLDRKLNSIALLTDLVKDSKGDSDLKVDPKELQKWFVQNEIIHKIYQENSHPELISRSSELLKLYLGSNPSLAIIQPLLNDLSQPILKVISQNITSLPHQFLSKVAKKLTSDSKLVLNDEIILILRVVGGYELWALERGGQCWVDLVKYKKNRRADLQKLFAQSLDVICKVFIEMIEKDLKLSKVFMNEAYNLEFVPKLIQSNIEIAKKLEFLKYFFRELDEVDDNTLILFSKLWNQTYKSQNNKNFLQTFNSIIEVLDTRQLLTFSKNCFTSDKLKDILLYGFLIFKKVIHKINNSDLDFLSSLQSPYGVDKILEIVFQNQRIQVTKKALEFIFTLIADMKSQGQITKFKQNLLEKCLSRLYEGQNYEKYLAILQGILNQSEKSGNGGLEPLAKQLPALTIEFVVLNHFNQQNRTRFNLFVNSNITLYEFRYLIGQHVNAYGYQLKLNIPSPNTNTYQLIEELYNGLTLQQTGLQGVILVTRKGKIKRAQLTYNNKLVPDAVKILTNVFNDYSIDGLMSKDYCKRLIKRIAGDSILTINHKVDKIFQNYDADKDENLKLQDLINYFEYTANTKPTQAWSSLQTLGARQDLKILDNIELLQPNPTTLPRYFLINNKQFMELLFNLIKNDDKIAQASWNLLFRLPIYSGQVTNNSKYGLRYWLYKQDLMQKSQLNQQVFGRIVLMDDDTLLMGLKVADKNNLEIVVDQLKVLIHKVEGYNKEKVMNTCNQLILGFSLKLICKALQKTGVIQEYLLQGEVKLQQLFMNGLLSSNTFLRRPYLESITGILENSADSNIDIFKRLFVMLEKGLERELSSLTSQYFELFSQILGLASKKSLLVEQSESILQKIIEAFKQHQSTESNLTSPEDHISIGFIKLIKGLLLTSGSHHQHIITFLFCECLFPEQNTSGAHKLRSHSSRKQAYDLIVNLCKNDPQSLKQLFKCNFKNTYKKVAELKDSYYLTSKIRSQYGYAGIQNLGCICYMISMIQQFFMVPAFRYLMMLADDGLAEDFCKIQQPQQQYFPMMRSYTKQDKVIDDNVLHQFQLLFANLELTQKQDVDPTDFCLSFKDIEGQPVNVMIQQDAQQFLNMLFDKLQNAIKNTPFKNVVNNIYAGKQCNQFICPHCKNANEKHQNFFSVLLQVKGFKNIYESFNKFIQGETISDYKCEGCNKKVDVTKRSYISQLPNYLILYLQRICFDYDKFENQKVNSRLEFPHDLDIYDYTLQGNKAENKPSQTIDYQYRLKGIVVHIGSAEYGHYFSYILNDNGQWLQFNDENVRQFDPADISAETFGGGSGWRKDHQNAYLLVYEKVKKSQIKLEFDSIEQKQRILKILKIQQIIKQSLVQTQQNEAELQDNITKSRQSQVLQEQSQQSLQLKQKSSNVSDISQQAKQTNPLSPSKQKQPQKTIAYIDPTLIEAYVKADYKQKINKQNEQFTLDIHLASNQFFEFIYNIAMIDTIPELKNQLLLLCSETFPSTHAIGSQNILLSQEMPKRFNQLIDNVGWQFYLQKRKKWKLQILALESSTRQSTKNVMVSTISDILKHLDELKQHSLKTFLNDFWQFNKTQQMQWYAERSVQYFQFWSEILDLHEDYFMDFFMKNRAIATLLRYVIIDKHFPPISSKKRRMYEYHSQQPLFFIIKLIEKGYQIDKVESKGISSYSFIQKFMADMSSNIRIISQICKSNSLTSERVCYSIISNIPKIIHSNQSKPLIEAIKQLLSINDELKQIRKQWIFGYPQFSQHLPDDAVGLYGLSGPDEQMRIYYSPLGVSPLLTSLFYLKDKYEHITILFVTMMLELQKDGLLQITQFPSIQPLFSDYTHWFGEYIESYQHTAENYKQYGDKVRYLWKNRIQKEAKGVANDYLIGKIIEEKVINKYISSKTAGATMSYTYKKPELEDRKIQIIELEIKANIVKAQFDKRGIILHGSNLIYKQNQMYFVFEKQKLDMIENSQLFLRKISTEQEIEQEPELLEPMKSPFVNCFECNYIRKLKVSNPSKSSRIITLKITFSDNQANITFPQSPCRFHLQPEQEIIFVLTKKNPLKDWPQYIVQWDQVIEKSKKLSFFKNDEDPPKQIFTIQSQSQEQEEEQQDNQDEDDDDWPKDYMKNI